MRNDYWIPGFKNLHHEEIENNTRIETVKDLIDQHTQSWNYTKLQESFSPQIAVEIFKLRIPNHTTPDQLIWEAEP